MQDDAKDGELDEGVTVDVADYPYQMQSIKCIVIVMLFTIQ